MTDLFEWLPYYSVLKCIQQSKYEEKFVGDILNSGSDLNKAATAMQEQEQQGRKKQPKIIVRGITYYRSDPVDEMDPEKNCKYNFVDLIFTFKVFKSGFKANFLFP